DSAGVLQFELDGYAQGAIVPTDSAPGALDLAALRTGAPLEAAEIYARFAASGLHYGASFRCIERLWSAGSHACAELSAGTGPAVLDAAMQTAAALLAGGTRSHLVPFSLDALNVYGDL